MLTEADVCTMCGGRHEGRRGRVWERIEPACPVVLNGPFPVVMKVPEPSEIVLEVPGDAPETPDQLETPTTESPPARKPNTLSIPWPKPSFDEVYL